jgi:Putative auto-transporter adhesin, head GIN domain
MDGANKGLFTFSVELFIKLNINVPFNRHGCRNTIVVNKVDITDIKMKQLEIKVIGVGEVTLVGAVKSQVIDINGAGKVHAEACKGKQGKVAIKGPGEVQHKYGKQGTHTLKFRLEGTVENGVVTLQTVEPSVSGTWDYGGGTIELGGKCKITFKSE